MADQAPEQSKPHVTVLGEEVGKRHQHRRGRYSAGRNDVVFGMLMLFAGVVLLSNTLGLVSWDFWDVISRFWPLLLVLVGAQIVFGRGVLGWFFMFFVSLAAMGLVLVYGLLATDAPIAVVFPDELRQVIQWFIHMTTPYL